MKSQNIKTPYMLRKKLLVMGQVTLIKRLIKSGFLITILLKLNKLTKLCSQFNCFKIKINTNSYHELILTVVLRQPGLQ